VVATALVTAIELAVFVAAKDAVDLFGATTVLGAIAYLLTLVSFAFAFRRLPPPVGLSLGSWRRPIVIAASLWQLALIGVLTIPGEFHRVAQISGVVIALGLPLSLMAKRGAS
jgi:hypothetical protein